MPLIRRVEDKGRVGTVCVVTAITLCAGLGRSALDHLITLTMRAQHRNEHHDILLVKKVTSWHTSGQKATSETLPGFVASLARPGRNITGVSGLVPEVAGKRLQLLSDVVPHAARVAVLWNATHAGKGREWHATQGAAQALGVTLQSIEVRGPDDFGPAFAVLTTERPDALLTLAEPLTLMHRREIADFAITHRLPMMSQLKEFAEAGALLTYGTSLVGLFRRAAYYVDRILKGAKPADLPVEQPTKFELVLNLKTAKTLGITIPPSLLLLAEEVIQ